SELSLLIPLPESSDEMDIDKDTSVRNNPNMTNYRHKLIYMENNSQQDQITSSKEPNSTLQQLPSLYQKNTEQQLSLTNDTYQQPSQQS
ncbi:34722_t:CDS:2, partial [Racocetra persica]